MNDRDRYPYYLSESLDLVHHYVNYRGRSYQDLVDLQKAVDDLNLAINNRLIRGFKHIQSVAEDSTIEQ